MTWLFAGIGSFVSNFPWIVLAVCMVLGWPYFIYKAFFGKPSYSHPYYAEIDKIVKEMEDGMKEANAIIRDIKRARKTFYK